MFPITERCPSIIDWNTCKHVICYTQGDRDSENAASILVQHIQCNVDPTPIWIDDMSTSDRFDCTFKDNVTIYFLGAHPTTQFLLDIANRFSRIVVIDNGLDCTYSLKLLYDTKHRGLVYDNIQSDKTLVDIVLLFLGIDKDKYTIYKAPAVGYCCSKKIIIDNVVYTVNIELTTFGGLLRYLQRTFHCKAMFPTYCRDDDQLPEHFIMCVSLNNKSAAIRW